ncbi:hypothetical protein [Embleya scabrispora]|uniref:hypothetical protein n=1 Tax=Embleya scabrispora TaxID=159449 RepID=UPI000377FD6D|nr:hypothetical protein [Embleya scabrispora]MYS85621.1 hypothetical protein [Streptomyces sp. SID5474]
MTASAARSTPHRGSGGRPPAEFGPLARRLAPAGIALPVLIVACTLCAVAADTDLADARGLWILAAAVCAVAAAVAWADVLIVVHRRRPSPGAARVAPPTEDPGPAPPVRR